VTRRWRAGVAERPRSHVGHAVRTALVAAGVIAVLYLAVVSAFDAVVVHRLLGQVDSRLADRLHDAALAPGTEAGLASTPSVPATSQGDADVDAAPVFVWRVNGAGRVTAQEPGAPRLVPGAWTRRGTDTTATLGASVFRLAAVPSSGGWLVAGASLAEERHVTGLLVAAEAVAGPFVVLAMFLGALLIGVRASRPVEQARRRQLEFTADASHELRTPLSVIEAEVSLALRSPRDAASYRGTIERVGHESARLLRLVDDMLWLARFDSTPPPPSDEPVDLSTVADRSIERFRTLAGARQVTLQRAGPDAGVAWVSAPPEWVERLAGVLVDNACRYAPLGGHARVSVEPRSGRVALVVEDDGPGIAPDEQARLFDRFHRASDEPGGTGLGLAIADSIVRSTGGRWRVGRSELGGARLEVSWHRSARGHPPGRGPASQGPTRSSNTNPSGIPAATVDTSTH